MRHPTLLGAAVALIAAVLPFSDRAHAQEGVPTRYDVLSAARVDAAGVVLRVDPVALTAATASGDAFRVTVPLSDSQEVELELRRFWVTTPETRFVLGRKGAPDVALPFRDDSVVLLRGSVIGTPGSHAYLAFSPYTSNGFIELGRGAGRYGITSMLDATGAPISDEIVVVPVHAAGGSLPPGVPTCGVERDTRPPQAPPQRPGVTDYPPTKGLRQLQLAVETDYEYFQLFNDLNAANAYVVQLYGAVSDIYVRDVNAHITLSFVRLWDDPNDLFNEPDPLQPFQQYWNANMQQVTRDTAQFFSGRRNLPAGGVAYLPGLCGNSAYSWAGYALGFFVDPNIPHIYNRDVMVTAHEIGHNCGTPHTHDLGLDTCDNENTPPRRGTIMSYCGQTFTGGDGNMDLYFHTVCAELMRSTMAGANCIANDCNANGVPDATDISNGVSKDVNGNGIPDECEDCNGNNVLDPNDIGSGFSKDQNGNGIPDECEPDCNGNGKPDDMDFKPTIGTPVFSDNFETDKGWTVQNLGATAGDWERGVPVNDPNWDYDPISDADGSGQCLLTQNAPGNTDVDNGATRVTSPKLDMSAGGLGVQYAYFLRLTNSNGADRILVEGSSNDLAGPWAVLATHTANEGLDWVTYGISAADFAAAGLTQTANMRLRFTINDANPQSIVEGGLDAFVVAPLAGPVSEDVNGNTVPDECEPDCDNNGQIDYAQIIADMALDLNRNVALDDCEDCDNDNIPDLVELDHSHFCWLAGLDLTNIREYLNHTGTNTLVSANAGLSEAQDLIITSDRRILVSSRNDHRVVEFKVDGSLAGDLVASGAGGLAQPAAMLVSKAGTLLVASRGTNSVLEYNLSTGAFIKAFVSAGAGGLSQPFGLAYGTNGNLYVTSFTNEVLEFDGATGAFVKVFVSAANNGGLSDPHGMLFLPKTGNLLVASYGTDAILEYNGQTGAFVRQFSQVGNGTVLTFDQPWCIRLGPNGDVYASRAHDHEGPPGLHLTNARIYQFDAESGWFMHTYVMGVNSGVQHPTGFDFVPDQGTDCNDNLKPDNCDIASGFSKDVNNNGIPDECEAACLGDLNGDKVVGQEDLGILLATYGLCEGQPGYNPIANIAPNPGGPQCIDQADLGTLLSVYGNVCP